MATIQRGKQLFRVDRPPVRLKANGPPSERLDCPTVIYARAGSSRTIVECLVCGDTHTWSSRYPIPAHGRAWIEEHRHGAEPVETTPSNQPHYCEERVDNQGLCHTCGTLVNPDWWALYAGEQHATE